MRPLSITYFILGVCLLGWHSLQAQTFNYYEIAFPNAVHHEAEVKASFTALEDRPLELRMSRTSPGRYALHEFAKNVYNVRATDGAGNELSIKRIDPHQWNVSGHDGTVHFFYTLFANRGDGTYAQVDETHAHLNIPATFIYAPEYGQRPIKVKFQVRNDLNWKVATQLKDLGDNTFYAPNLHYFMDSPTEISDFAIREWKQSSNGKNYSIRFVLHHRGTEDELDEYAEMVKKIVDQEQKVYGELPEFDFGTYTFLACYQDNVSGDGMEHRNSTILTDREGLGEGGMLGNIGTVSHEFFHAWNVERIRPKSLEPFDYTEANMSGELWFAEGFTSYYTSLILCRAGIISPEQYVNRLAGSLNYVWNSPGGKYFGPIEMSYQAPFVDAARSVDPTNRQNTFISYYSYGSVLGLALDLSLRNLSSSYDLDGFMQLMWEKYGREEIPYTNRDIEKTLGEYCASPDFAQDFFQRYIFKSEMPDYEKLFASVGVDFSRSNPNQVRLGVGIDEGEGQISIAGNPNVGSPAYDAYLIDGDILLSIDGVELKTMKDLQAKLKKHKVGDKLNVEYSRFGEKRSTSIICGANQSYQTQMFEQMEKKVDPKTLGLRDAWLGAK